ncbi:hypothetical protein JQ615_17120 [Bradyrhizobium jicamae]|uniref:Invasion protein n=1 Tax=Bradyrhizobium jicamae TaxID=280332 RepID=A0ABS5FK05_9BRAD|nr:hypothetical protein [Bradyrhizobium jicamae]MBR0797115.1 hypothetical protein [Bradyrhizobium jicamae]MBR0937627.1 hypothetical protein [Bradyrhizobium jicamae]
MRSAAILFVAGMTLASGVASAQAEDRRIAQLRDCSPAERARNRECSENAPRATAPRRADEASSWIISLTTSPVDYSPVATATTSARDGAGGPGIKLSIRCRGGRSDLIVTGPGISGRSADYAISYRVNDGQARQIASVVPASGDGVGFAGDVVGLLQSLPEGGSLSIHLTSRLGTAVDIVFPLDGLNAVRAKMAAACRWPGPAAKSSG